MEQRKRYNTKHTRYTRAVTREIERLKRLQLTRRRQWLDMDVKIHALEYLVNADLERITK